MTVTLTWQTIVSAGAVLAALITIATYVAKIVRWVDHQKQQDKELEGLRQQHEEELEALREQQEFDKKVINDELCLNTYGLLACLKGLHEQGCNGPVTEAIQKIEKHLNQKAHMNI